MVELEIAFGITKGPTPMGEAVQTMLTIVPVVPIVEKIIMEQSGAYQRTQIHLVPQVHSIRDPYGQTGHPDGMRVCGDHTMLVAGSFNLHAFMAENVVAINMHYSLYLRTRQQHRFAFSF